jgi:DNA primase
MDVVAYEALTGHPVTESHDNWKTLCPVHSERTPSFFIHKDTCIAHCFGCGAQGYVDNILAQVYVEKPRVIRKQLNITAGTRLARIDNNTWIPELFPVAQLAGFPKIQSHKWLTNRGVSDEAIAAHDTRWDWQSARLVFPLKHMGEGVKGAVGRSLRAKDPKWHFYWNTDKGHLLYCNTVPNRTAIVVEGMFDVMALWDAGYKQSVVAPIGAMLTKYQIGVLKERCDHVIVFLDNDQAGQIGTRLLSQRLRGDCVVTFARYPDDRKDPQQLTAAEIQTAIQTRLTYVEYSKLH